MKRNLRLLGIAASVAVVIAACVPQPPQNTSTGSLQMSTYQVRSDNSVRLSSTTASFFLPATGFPEAGMWDEAYWPTWESPSPSSSGSASWDPYRYIDIEDVYPLIGFALFPLAWVDGADLPDVWESPRLNVPLWPSRGSSRVYGTPRTPLVIPDELAITVLSFGEGDSPYDEEFFLKYNECNQFVETYLYLTEVIYDDGGPGKSAPGTSDWGGGWDEFTTAASVYVPRANDGSAANMVETPGFGGYVETSSSPTPSSSSAGFPAWYSSPSLAGTLAPAGSMFRFDQMVTIGDVGDTAIYRLVAMHGRWIDADSDGMDEDDTIVCDGTVATTITARGGSGFPQDPADWDFNFGGSFGPKAVTIEGLPDIPGFGG